MRRFLSVIALLSPFLMADSVLATGQLEIDLQAGRCYVFDGDGDMMYVSGDDVKINMRVKTVRSRTGDGGLTIATCQYEAYMLPENGKAEFSSGMYGFDCVLVDADGFEVDPTICNGEVEWENTVSPNGQGKLTCKWHEELLGPGCFKQ